jgi:DNA replication and repair protein RecF
LGYAFLSSPFADPCETAPFAVADTCALAATRIALSDFRSYATTELSLGGPAPVVLCGPNGIGKTNLLEAVSLLSPGRGLRGARLPAMLRKNVDGQSAESWAVSATLTRVPEGEWQIGAGYMSSTPGMQPRRVFHLNGVPAEAAEIAELVPVLWLTPAMDRLFLEGAQLRRRFLDRLVFALVPAHARKSARYERALSDRLHLLREGSRRGNWLDALEKTMAEDGAAINAARQELTDLLNAELNARRAEGAFPCAHLSLAGEAGDVSRDPAALMQLFAASRQRDGESGRTNCGPHTVDLEVRHVGKNSDARECSTGEQKALLISIVLADAWLKRKRHGVAPMLLLDEIAAHLDAQRRAALFEEILALNSQAWLTGTDRQLFSPLYGRAEFVTVENGRFVPAGESAA